jgi:hypothetical protein
VVQIHSPRPFPYNDIGVQMCPEIQPPGTGGPGIVVELWVPRSFRCGGKGGVFDVIPNLRSPYGINANQPGFLLRIE